MKLVAAERQRMNAEIVEVHRNLADGLHRVAVKGYCRLRLSSTYR